jgi:RsiW-degrading membrane proteinase PrsW (M82 family)
VSAAVPAAPPPNVLAATPRTRRWAVHSSLFQPRKPAFWLFVVLLALGALYFLLEQLIYLLVSPAGLALSWLLLALYIVPVVLVVRWLDLYEREPPSLLIGAFVWGAIIAVPFSGLNNSVWGVVVSRLGGAELASYWSAALTAPVVEETYKYLGLAVLFLIARTEFDDLMDGFVYGALVGLGFSVVEDIGYFMIQFGGDVEGVLFGFFVRVIASGLYGHVLYTGLAGVGLAYFATRHGEQPLAQRLLVAGGLLGLAIGAHFFWNSPWFWPASGDDVAGLLLATTIKGLPFFIGLFVLLRLARGREHRALAEALSTEVGRPGLLAEELEWLREPRRRRDARRRVGRAAGPPAVDLFNRLQRAQLNLALTAPRIDSPDHAELLRLRAQSHALRSQLWQGPGVIEALGLPTATVEAARQMPAPYVWQVQARVAAAGGWAWATPDLADPRRGPLWPGMPLQVMQQQGNWLLVRAENGWLGWTDSRYLFPTAV